MPRSRNTKLVVTWILVGATMLVGASSAPAGPRCTLRGTSGDDRLIDTAGASVICALGGSDLVEGGLAADRIFGGKGSDRLEGNEGKDVVRGGRGADTIVVTDGAAGDRALGGPGRDTCYLDRGDRAKSCETKTVVA